MTTILVIALGTAGALAWLLLRHSGGKHPQHSAPHAAPAQTKKQAAAHRAIGKKVVLDANCCQAVLAIRDRWYPSGESPQLPLANCDHPHECRCHYETVPDPRKDIRRKARERRAMVRFEAKPDRRKDDGRRKEDRIWRKPE